jgi:short-subunit dehydrogenase
LASNGCNLVLTARRTKRLEELKEETLKHHSIQIITIPMDLADLNAPIDLYHRIKSDDIPIDVLVNNAGFGIYGQFIHTKWQEQQDLLLLNMVSLTHLTRLFAADMVVRDFGYILNLSSNSAYQPSPKYATYGASKSFVLNFSEALNYEFRDTNVKCTALAPGTMVTEFHQVSGQRVDTFYYKLSRMDSSKIARIGLRALLKGRPSVVLDWKIALAAWLSQRIPRRWATILADKMVG